MCKPKSIYAHTCSNIIHCIAAFFTKQTKRSILFACFSSFVQYAISPFTHNNAKVCHFHFHTYQWQSMPFPRSHISMSKYAIPHSHITMPKYAISPFSHINAKVCHFPILTYQCQSMPFLHFNVKVCHCPFPCKKPNYAIAPSRH